MRSDTLLYIYTCISFSHRFLFKDGYKLWQLNLRASNLIRQLKSSVYIIFILVQCKKLYQIAYFQGLRWKHSHQENNLNNRNISSLAIYPILVVEILYWMVRPSKFKWMYSFLSVIRESWAKFIYNFSCRFWYMHENC